MLPVAESHLSLSRHWISPSGMPNSSGKGCRFAGRSAGNPQPVRTYYGGIDLAFTQTQLLESLEAQLKRGHTAVKIKLGKPGDQEDLDRIRAVRQLIGDDALFLVDVNMVWDVEKAIRMARRMEEFRIHWLEEPTNPDDYEGYARIAQATTIPIAMGENLHTIYEHELALKLGRISYPIPDCSNICGITGFVKVAKLADTYHLPVSSHGMQELHVNFAGRAEKSRTAGISQLPDLGIHAGSADRRARLHFSQSDSRRGRSL